jgi:outer membrane protein assembly factor BamB
MIARILALAGVGAILWSCTSPYGAAPTESEGAPAALPEEPAGDAPAGAAPAAAPAPAPAQPPTPAPSPAPAAVEELAALLDERAGDAAPASPAAASGALPEAAVFPVKEGESPMWGRTPARNMANPTEKGIPSSWDIKTRKNIKWVAALGSQSYGNPSIAGGRIYVGTNNQGERNPEVKGDKGIIMCFREADGEFLWQAVHDKLESGRVNDWPEQGICSGPAVEGGVLYYVSNRAEVVCADAEGFLDGENDGPYQEEKHKSKIDGDFIWVYDMMEELGVFPHNLATCSPLVVGDLLYIVTANGVERDHITIPSPRSPSFIALDKKSGKLVWESAAPGEKILHGQWSTPCYIVAGGRGQIVFPGGDGWLRSFEPLKGELIWEFDCNPKDSVWVLGGRGTRNNLIATPVAAGGRVFIAVGQDPEHGEGVGHLYSIDASKTGDVTESGRVWHYGDKEFRRTIATVSVADGLVFAADLSGFLHCLDEQSGRPYWVHDTLAAVWGSPTVIDGKVYLGDEDGDLVVLAASKEKKVLFETNFDNSVYTTPVAAKGVLYIVSRTHLFAITEAK